MFLPTKLCCGEGIVRSEQNAISALGANSLKALIVTGGHSAWKNGSMNDLTAALESGGTEYTVFSGVEPDPSVDTVLRAAKLARSECCGFVCGVGGGSALDAAKAVAFLLANPSYGREELFDSTTGDSHVPLVLIPTTCGTGSEVTPVSVLTVPELSTKRSIAHRIFAELAFLDPCYLETAPLAILRNTALDALTHLIESLINTRADEFSRMFVSSGLKLWAQSRDILEGRRAPARADLMKMLKASAMAGMAIAQTSTTVPHGLSYSLTYKLGVPHGAAVGYFTAGYLEAAAPEDREEILSAVGFESAEQFGQWVEQYYELPEVRDDILEAAVEELSKNTAKLSAVPFPLDREALCRIAFYTKEHKGGKCSE